MSSLSQDMKNKRDVKRRAAILIVDGDLGNIGLYKSILAMEYELECVNTIPLAISMCNVKKYDVIIADGGLGTDSVIDFFSKARDTDNGGAAILLVMSEPSNKEQIISCMCHGAVGYIAMPFTKDGMSTSIYNVLKAKRDSEVRNSVVIIDDDMSTLNVMKECLKDKYTVYIMNSCVNVPEFIKCRKPGLIIADVRMPEKSGIEICTQMKALRDNTGIPMLFMTDKPDGEVIARCAQFNPEGFIVKPIDKDTLLDNIDNIFIRESYMTSVGEI